MWLNFSKLPITGIHGKVDVNMAFNLCEISYCVAHTEYQRAKKLMRTQPVCTGLLKSKLCPSPLFDSKSSWSTAPSICEEAESEVNRNI